MATRTIIVHDRCTTEGCNRVLHSILEGERGTCSSCWHKAMKPETKQSLNKLVRSAFDGSTDEQRAALVEDAMKQLDLGKRCPKCDGLMIHSRLNGYQCQRCPS